MGIRKEVEFDVGGRSYRIITSLNNSYDIHGFNALTEKVAIHQDLNSGEQIFVNWSKIATLRFRDAPEE